MVQQGNYEQPVKIARYIFKKYIFFIKDFKKWYVLIATQWK